MGCSLPGLCVRRRTTAGSWSWSCRTPAWSASPPWVTSGKEGLASIDRLSGASGDNTGVVADKFGLRKVVVGVTKQVDSYLPIFLKRLKNEITRLTMVNAPISIASSSSALIYAGSCLPASMLP